jgi:hypothetical protein
MTLSFDFAQHGLCAAPKTAAKPAWPRRFLRQGASEGAFAARIPKYSQKTVATWASRAYISAHV